MTRGEALELRVLGPLEVLAGGERLALGGGKQRAVLAALLLRAGEVVPVERLIDEVWGDDPPPSAAHTLEAYVSRIRQVLNGHGPTVVRRGAGYALELRGARLDADEFERLAEEAWRAAAQGRFEDALRQCSRALALWRGPALADVALASGGRADAERLEEARLRVFEERFDAELALGRHERIVGELQRIVGQNPYRERFVAQLMLALYRAGRHAEALEVYERTRRRLDDDLGLQPSSDLQQLSGQIVRQEPQLRRPPRVAIAPAALATMPERARRMAGLVLAGAVTMSVLALTASGSSSSTYGPGSSATKRVALVLPRSPEAAIDDPRVRVTVQAFQESIDRWSLDGEIVVADEVDPAPADVENAARRLEDGGFALVLVLGGGATARALAPVVSRMADTRFAFVDASLTSLSLERTLNATGVPFADFQTGQLAGYVSGLVPPLARRSTQRADVVSIVVSQYAPRVERIVREFTRGARRALPRVRVLVDHVEDERDKTSCERLANAQIDAGSDVIYALAGECSASVLAVAKFRGVWGIRANDDDVDDGPHILATTYKRWNQAIEEIVALFEDERLPGGRDLALTLADNYAVDMLGGGAPEVSAAWSKVVRLCSRLRQHSETIES